MKKYRHYNWIKQSITHIEISSEEHERSEQKNRILAVKSIYRTEIGKIQ
jgi:hypothetical protein